MKNKRLIRVITLLLTTGVWFTGSGQQLTGSSLLRC